MTNKTPYRHIVKNGTTQFKILDIEGGPTRGAVFDDSGEIVYQWDDFTKGGDKPNDKQTR